MFEAPPKTAAVHRRTFLQLASAGGAGLLIGAPRRLAALESRPGGVPADKRLIVRSQDPFNAEPALEDLVRARITPIEYFYVRNHAPTPKIDAAAFRLRVEGRVRQPLELSLAQLKQRFRKETVEATLICAGNRRREFNAIAKVGGVQWDAGAIGNARWSGAALSQLLNMAGLKEDAKHVWFDGADRIPFGDEVISFGGSIPLDKALGDSNAAPGALVAYEMNEKPLTADHGYPMRTIVPGYIGARSVKWLAKIVVSDRPSPNHYVAEAYKIVASDAAAELVNQEPIYQFPINAAICLPAAPAKLKVGRLTVAGYALARGDARRTIARVEVSADDGQTWADAELTTPARPYCWRLWKIDAPISPRTTQLVARATDSAGERQPRHTPWNYKGYLFNAWRRTPIQVG